MVSLKDALFKWGPLVVLSADQPGFFEAQFSFPRYWQILATGLSLNVHGLFSTRSIFSPSAKAGYWVERAYAIFQPKYLLGNWAQQKGRPGYSLSLWCITPDSCNLTKRGRKSRVGTLGIYCDAGRCVACVLGRVQG